MSALGSFTGWRRTNVHIDIDFIITYVPINILLSQAVNAQWTVLSTMCANSIRYEIILCKWRPTSPLVLFSRRIDQKKIYSRCMTSEINQAFAK